MIAYAETSAVLTWLLGETHETEVRRILGGAERVVSSSLTSVECARVLARGGARVSLAQPTSSPLCGCSTRRWPVGPSSR